MNIATYVLHWNRPEECARTATLFAADPAGLTVTVIDNASKPENLARLRELLPAGVAVRIHDANRGWGGGFNPSLRDWLASADGEVVFISAHDSLPEPGCCSLLVETMRRNGRLGVACPEYPDGCTTVFSPVRGQRLAPRIAAERGEVVPMDFAHGTLMVFRRGCLEDIGLFDERYFAHGDETEISLRARRRGWQVGQVSGAVVVNPASWTPDSMKGYLSTRGSLLLARDYGGWFAAVFRALLILLNTGRLMLHKRAEGISSASTRIRAVCDFAWGRFGPPPTCAS